MTNPYEQDQMQYKHKYRAERLENYVLIIFLQFQSNYTKLKGKFVFTPMKIELSLGITDVYQTWCLGLGIMTYQRNVSTKEWTFFTCAKARLQEVVSVCLSVGRSVTQVWGVSV